MIVSDVGRVTDYETPEEAFRAWVFTGNCPCCFPEWKFSELDIQGTTVLDWREKYSAWAMYDEIQREEDDE